MKDNTYFYNNMIDMGNELISLLAQEGINAAIRPELIDLQPADRAKLFRETI